MSAPTGVVPIGNYKNGWVFVAGAFSCILVLFFIDLVAPLLALARVNCFHVALEIEIVALFSLLVAGGNELVVTTSRPPTAAT